MRRVSKRQLQVPHNSFYYENPIYSPPFLYKANSNYAYVSLSLIDLLLMLTLARKIFGKLSRTEASVFSVKGSSSEMPFSQPNRIFGTKNILYDFFCTLQVVFIAYHYVKTHSELNCSHFFNNVVKQKKAPSNSYPL